MESLALRLDYGNGGFFYTGEVEKKIKLFARDSESEPRTFFEYYVFNADGPFDTKAFIPYADFLLKRPGYFRFAFTGYESVHRLLGLESSAFLVQFRALFHDPLFRARVLLVDTPAWTNDEILYRAGSEVLVETVTCLERFMELRWL